MSFFKIFDVAGSAMTAQSLRLNTTASNIANAQNVSGDPESVYKAKYTEFSTVLNEQSEATGVKVNSISESEVAALKLFDPKNPIADKEGYVYKPDISVIEEMANMISASRSYQDNVDVMNTAKQLMMSTLKLGQ